jgi:hypothetical protein
MTIQKRQKLNQTLSHWPESGLRTAGSLRAQGISTALLAHYARNGWLKQAGRGVYRRPGDKPGWAAAFQALCEEKGMAVHVGGLSALELQGYGRYIPLGDEAERPLFVNGPAKTRLPAWFVGSVGRPVQYAATDLFAGALPSSVTAIRVDGQTVQASAPERAVLEMLALVPQKLDFGDALDVVSGLAELRPAVLQDLLEKCRSIKVKRLFFYCARESGHVWYAALDRRKVNLGSGKRELIKGGTLDKEFLLTVPKPWYDADAVF